MDKKVFTVNFEHISIEDLYNANTHILKVEKDGVNFFFRLFLKQNAQTIVNFSNGPHDPKKNIPPFFSRSSWQEDLKSHCLFIDDPMLHNSDLRIGWGIGNIDHYYLESISTIIKKIIEILNIKSSNTFYFGSSAGGYMSIMLATMHESSVAITNNPQFYVDEQRAIKFLKSLYPNISDEEIDKKFMHRFSFYKLHKKLNYFPKIIYIVNRLSQTDMEKQYKPLLKYLDENPSYNRYMEIIQYHSPNGHSGIYSREKTSELLNGIILNRLGILNFSKISVAPTFVPNFNTLNIMGWLIKTSPYSGFINIPLEYFRKDNYSEVQFKYSNKKGMLNLILLSEYISPNGENTLQLEILKNDYIIGKEDMAKWNKKNSINIYNLVQDDVITIRVRSLQDRNGASWSNASTVQILSYEEIQMKTRMDQSLSSNSPFMQLL